MECRRPCGPASGMKLINWNVAKRKNVQAQVEALATRSPGIVALQEVSYLRSEAWTDALSIAGLPHSAYSRDPNSAPSFKHGVMIASRWPIARLEQPPVPFPESALVVRIEAPAGPLDVLTLHAPNGSNYGVKKEETFEAVFDYLARGSDVPRIVCGDLNTPFEERPDGTVITFGQRVRKSGTIALSNDGGRKDRAERNILLGLAEHDLPDVFRALYGYEAEASSWRRFRLDHVFASRSLCARSCTYLDEFREAGLSDHSAVEAVFGPKAYRVDGGRCWL